MPSLLYLLSLLVLSAVTTSTTSMSEATATASPDYPDVPNDAQWNKMLQRELLCGKDGELALFVWLK